MYVGFFVHATSFRTLDAPAVYYASKICNRTQNSIPTTTPKPSLIRIARARWIGVQINRREQNVVVVWVCTRRLYTLNSECNKATHISHAGFGYLGFGWFIAVQCAMRRFPTAIWCSHLSPGRHRSILPCSVSTPKSTHTSNPGCPANDVKSHVICKHDSRRVRFFAVAANVDIRNICSPICYCITRPFATVNAICSDYII